MEDIGKHKGKFYWIVVIYDIFVYIVYSDLYLKTKNMLRTLK